jgi:hypothetical protein
MKLVRKLRGKNGLQAELLESRCLLAGDADVFPLLPDLIPLTDEPRGFLHGWTIEEQQATTLLRLSTTSINLGNGPLELRGSTAHPDRTRDVLQRIYNSDGSFEDRLAGQFVHHPTHGHVHFEDYAQYNLRATLADDAVGDIVASVASS